MTPDLPSQDSGADGRRIREHDLLRELDEVNARPRTPVDPGPGVLAPDDGASGRDDPQEPLRP